MDIILCPLCGTRVFRSADGICPACRLPIGDEASRGGAPVAADTPAPDGDPGAAVPDPSAPPRPATTGPDPRPPGRPKRDLSGREPFRSRPLGWALKAAGLAWIVLVVWADLASYLPEKQRELGYFYLNRYFIIVPCLPGLALLWWGYRLSLRTFAPGRHGDARPPVVYLRGFADDGRGTFQPRTFAAKLHGLEPLFAGEPGTNWLTRPLPTYLLHPGRLLRAFFNADRGSAEEVLAAAFRDVGPFVAIGRPGELLATPGADRMYVPDGRWQAVVTDHLARARAVVLQPSKSEGVRWEVRQVFQTVPRERVLLSLINFRDKPADYQEFRHGLEADFGVRLPAGVPDLDAPCFVYFEPDGTPRLQQICYTSPFLWSFTSNGVDIDRTFQTFIRGLYGAPREEPLAPQRHLFHATASTLLPFLAIVGLTMNYRYPGETRALLAAARDGFGEMALSFGDLTTYRGRSLDYQFQAGPGWSPITLPDQPMVEYAFVQKYGRGRCVVSVVEQEAVSDEELRELVTGQLTEDVRQKFGPGSVVVRITDRKLTVDGHPAREFKFQTEKKTGQGVEYEWDYLRIYQSQGRMLTAFMALPLTGSPDYQASEFLDTLRLTGPPAKAPDDPDKALAREGRPVTYHGTAMDYTLTLPPVWKPGAVEAAAGNRLGVKVPAAELRFDAGEPKVAGLECLVTAEGYDPSQLDDLAGASVLARHGALQALNDGKTWMSNVVDQRTLTVDGRTWGEFETRHATTTGDREFRLLTRFTTEHGRSLTLTARIDRDTPAVRKLVLEALDSARVPAAVPHPAGVGAGGRRKFAD